MNRKVFVLVAVALTFLAVLTAAALGANWITTCGFSHANHDDPIVFPSQPGASHEHLFVGARTTDAHSTYSSLSASETTCVMRGDRSGYWVPRPNYPLHASGGMLFYYTGSPNVRPFPEGLKILLGNARATSEAGNPAIAQGRIKWKCGPGSGTETNAPPASCSSGMLVAVVTLPGWWDGRNLDSADHLSHMSYRRDAAHPVEVPRIKAYVRFAVPKGAPIDLRLASGPYYTMHLDFMNGWVTSELQRFIDACIKTGRNCGQNPS